MSFSGLFVAIPTFTCIRKPVLIQPSSSPRLHSIESLDSSVEVLPFHGFLRAMIVLCIGVETQEGNVGLICRLSIRDRGLVS